MKVGELCSRLNVAYRHARYVLEEGILPQGVEENPGRGEHRDLTPAQAFWLAVVLVLKQSGMKTSLAATIAEMTSSILRSTTQNFGWEPSFNPARGLFKTEHQWYADIGDLRYFRMATTACPSDHRLLEGDWRDFVDKKSAKDANPIVIIRVDLSGIARRLEGSD